MSSDTRRELRRLQDSPAFRTYEEVRRMCLCYSMMDSKLAELRNAVRRAGTTAPAHWSRYDVVEAETVEICQLLADFLSRMYSCKNLAAVCAKRHGIDPEFKDLKHRTLGFEASVMVNLRNYVVHVDMMPLEVDTSTGAVVFTRRCRGDDIWSTAQKRYLRSVDLETMLTVYSAVISSFYADYFSMLMSAVHPKLGACKREIHEANRRLGFEMVRFDPMAGMRA